jgi:hypothetical protein
MGRRIVELYDALLSGNDLEITPRLTLQRRPGYIQYSTASLNGTLLNTYSWKTASQGVFQIFDTTADVEYIGPTDTTPTVIFTKTADQIGVKGYMFGVGNYLFVSGRNFAFKWDGPGGTQGVTNWGIAGIASVAGPNIAGTGGTTGAGSAAWANPSNVTSTTAYATVIRDGTQFGHRFSGNLQATNFGFSIPAGTKIPGIQVTFDAYASVLLPGATVSVGLFNTAHGAGHFPFGIHTSTINSTTPIQLTFGGANDEWGQSGIITPAFVNASTFGCVIYVSVPPGPNGTEFFVNNVNITFFLATGPTVTPTGSGSFAAINGWSYVTAYGNPVSGEISNASPPSTNTGPFTGKASVQIALVASTDPQVSDIHVYRTTDSGGGTVFYELPNSPFPNATANVQDTATDNQLNVSNQAATNFQNTPPPVGLAAMEWFAGRLWGMVNNLLYFSTGPDSLSGLQQSNWNPVYVFVLPNNAPRLTALPNGLLAHTLDEILVVRGTATTNFTVNDFVKDAGLWSYNAADTDGSNVYMFTADRQFLALTASGMEEVGGGVIADQLQNIDPTQAYVTMYRSGLDAMIFLLDVSNQVLYPFNSRQQAWCLPALLKFPNITAAGAMEVQAGIWKYLIGTGTTLAQRDLNTFTDLGTTYAPNVVVGTIQEADPGTLAKMENVFLELTNAGSVPTVSVLANDEGVTLTNKAGSQVTGSFITLANPVNDPPTYGQTPVNYRSLRYQWLTSKAPESVKYVQILIQWPAEAAQNEVLGLGLSGKQSGDSPQVGQLPALQGH